MTVRENLQSFNVVFKCGLSKKQMDDLITKVNLEHCIDVNSTKLSGGERQRLSLAITLMRERDIYLFDEAETAMDPIGRKMFFDAVLTIKRKGKTALWISHHIKESLMVADKGYFLADGVAYSFNVKEYSEIAAEYTEEAFARLCEERVGKTIMIILIKNFFKSSFRDKTFLFFDWLFPVVLITGIAIFARGKNYATFFLPSLISFLLLQNLIYAIPYKMAQFKENSVLRIIAEEGNVGLYITSFLITRIILVAIQGAVFLPIGIVVLSPEICINPLWLLIGIYPEFGSNRRPINVGCKLCKECQ